MICIATISHSIFIVLTKSVQLSTCSVGMWDVTLGQPCVRHILTHNRCANAVAVAPNDEYISTGGSDQKVVSCLFPPLLVCYDALCCMAIYEDYI
jgi:hypothetical protein